MDNQRLVITAGSGLAALLLACAAAAYTEFFQVLLGWRGGYFPWLTLAVVLETLGARRRALREFLSIEFSRRAAFHALEWAAIALVTRVVVSFNAGLEQLPADLARWQADPLQFLAGEYGLVMLALILSAGLAAGFADDLDSLDLSPEEIQFERAASLSDRQPEVRRSVASKIIVLGGGLVLVTAATRLGLGQYLTESLQARLPVLALAAYFSAGMALLSLVHFAGLRKRWVLQEFSLPPGLGWHWLGWAAAFLGGVGLLAWLLPTRYTLGLLDVLGRLLSVLFQAGEILFGILIRLVALVLMPFELLLRLLGFRGGDEPAPVLPPLPTPVPAPAAALELPWLDLLKSLLFWLVLGGMAAAALYYGLRQSAGLGSLPLPIWLRNVLGFLRRGAGHIRLGVARAAAAGLRRLASRRKLPGSRRPTPLDRRRLDARRRIFRAYQGMLERAAGAGLGRKPAQTPVQYERELLPGLPQAAPELNQATTAFMEARYSAHPVNEEQAAAAASAAARVEKALREKTENPEGRH